MTNYGENPLKNNYVGVLEVNKAEINNAFTKIKKFRTAAEMVFNIKRRTSIVKNRVKGFAKKAKSKLA